MNNNFERKSFKIGEDLIGFIERGPRNYICPKCNKMGNINVNAEYYIGGDINGKDIFPVIDNIECIFCGEKISKSYYDLLDPGIANCIKILNDAGIKTKASCEGHICYKDNEESSIAYIAFDTNSLSYNDIEFIINNLPEDWMFSVNSTYTKQKSTEDYELYHNVFDLKDQKNIYSNEQYKHKILNEIEELCKKIYVYRKGEEYDT